MRYRKGIPEKEKGSKAGHLRYAEMETSVNNRISEALLNKYGHLEIKAAQPEVKKLGDGGGGSGLLWKGGGIERSVEGLQGLVCHCHPF